MYSSFERDTVKVLITAGGTKVPIDPVRDITNKSKGTFGRSISIEALRKNLEVTYLVSEDGRSFFRNTFNFYPQFNKDETSSISLNEMIADLTHWYQSCQFYKGRYREIRYTTFDEYAKLLEEEVRNGGYDAVILAAAVSDYVTANYSEEKIRSNEALTIQLKETPKLISQIKQWNPNVFLVGFKLLVDSTDQQLVEAAQKSIKSNDCNMVVANDWKPDAGHEILIVRPDQTVQKFSSGLGAQVIEEVLKGISK
jgi:phosphopantothenoylcysteine synthetase/decarboxylase